MVDVVDVLCDEGDLGGGGDLPDRNNVSVTPLPLCQGDDEGLGLLVLPGGGHGGVVQPYRQHGG